MAHLPILIKHPVKFNRYFSNAKYASILGPRPVTHIISSPPCLFSIPFITPVSTFNIQYFSLYFLPPLPTGQLWQCLFSTVHCTKKIHHDKYQSFNLLNVEFSHRLKQSWVPTEYNAKRQTKPPSQGVPSKEGETVKCKMTNLTDECQ